MKYLHKQLKLHIMKKIELYYAVNNMIELMGESALIDALVIAMSSEELESNLRYIDRVYETQVFNQSEDE